MSAGSDSTIWGVNRKDEIFRWTGSFTPVSNGALKQISVELKEYLGRQC